MNTTTSAALFSRAKKVLPGGVNSPVRAFRSVNGQPLFIASAQGATLTDVDGNCFIDYVGSWGPMILGHNHPAVRAAVEAAAQRGLSFGAPCEAEVDMAETICKAASIDMVRMVNSGTEAVMSALRVARGATGRSKIIKFAGCYHGHADAMLVKAGSGALTAGVPDSAGVPAAVAADTLTAQYNDLASVEALFEYNKGRVAALIVEPVAANMGLVLPQPGFLQGLRALCDAHGALLIFDEVITGFRLALGGAQEYFGIEADLVTYGKIIGGGMPVGAYGGKRRLMEQVAPLGLVYQAGTLSGNPVAMAAGLAQLCQLAGDKNLYTTLNTLGTRLAEGLRKAARIAGLAVSVNQMGSLCGVFFTPEAPGNLEAAQTANTKAFAAYFAAMLERGVYLAPSQFEAMFISAAHNEAQVDETLRAAASVFALLNKDRGAYGF